MMVRRRWPLFLAMAALLGAFAAPAAAQIGRPDAGEPPPSTQDAVPHGGAVGPNSGQRGSGVPRSDIFEVMVKTALLTLNDANLANDYSVMNARLHPEFRKQAPADRLAGIFAPFRNVKVDYSAMLMHAPTYTDGPRVDADGLLVVKGYMETRPWRTTFDLAWRQSEGNWWLWRINVQVRPPPR
jgi:hypothetical protein